MLSRNSEKLFPNWIGNGSYVWYITALVIFCQSNYPLETRYGLDLPIVLTRNTLTQNSVWWFSRIKFYTQEIVFFRQDLLYRMRRSSLIPPSTEETSDPFEHVGWFFSLLNFPDNQKLKNFDSANGIILFQLVATITHQSHLCPLPLTVQPIIWNYDHCLRLYPTPDLVSSLRIII